MRGGEFAASHIYTSCKEFYDIFVAKAEIYH